MNRRKAILVLMLAMPLVAGLAWMASENQSGRWTFRKLVCRGARISVPVSDIRWERDDPFRMGILFDLGERIYRGRFVVAADDFDKLLKAGGFSGFKGDFIPGGGPDPTAGTHEIYFRDVGQGQEFLWRQRGDTNAFYLQFNI